MTASAGPAWGPADAGLPLAADVAAVVLGTAYRVGATSAGTAEVVTELLAPFAPPAPAPAPA
ncbi:MAG: hypothetical protein ACLGIO_12345, partial [Acidimicrobiia bacterium]